MKNRQPGKTPRVAALICAAGLSIFVGHAHADATTERAKQLLDSQQGQEAFALLLPMESQRAGEVEFDLLLGLSALEAADPQRAIFALERVLAQQPGNGPARAAIGRAFFDAGDKLNARAAFEEAQKNNPPAQTRAVLDKYLSALSAPVSAQHLGGYFSFGLGSDNNINSATSQTSIFLPLFNLNTQYSGSRRSAGFGSFSAGVDGSKALTSDWSVVGSADFNYKDNIDNAFDNTSVQARLGGRWAQGPQAVTVAAMGAAFHTLDTASNRQKQNSLGGLVQWQRELDEKMQLGLIAQTQLSRQPGVRIRDLRRSTLGINLGRSLGGTLDAYIFGSVYFGQENARDADYRFLGHKPLGLVLSGQIRPAAKLKLSATLGYEDRKYNAHDPLWQNTRSDHTVDLRLNANWGFAPNWSFNPTVTYTRNASNVPVSAFDKTSASLTLRKDF